MSILDEIARGGRTSALDIAMSRSKGRKDALDINLSQQRLQMQAMEMGEWMADRGMRRKISMAKQRKAEEYMETEDIKDRAKEVYATSDFTTVEGMRETARKLAEAGDVQGARELELGADKQDYQNQKLALDKRKLDLFEKSLGDKLKIQQMKNYGNVKFKRASIAEAKSTGAMIINHPDFEGLEDKHKTTYAQNITQSVSDLMEASKGTGRPITRSEALEIIMPIAKQYIKEEGTIMGIPVNPFDSNKFDDKAFRDNIISMIPSLVGYSGGYSVTSKGIQTDNVNKQKEISDQINTYLGVSKE